MSNEIVTTEDIAASNGDEEVRSSIEATEEALPKGIGFHVTMTSWTLEDMEELIVEAAARRVLGRMNDNRLAKLIEDKVLAEISARANDAIARIADDVMGHALVPANYSQQAPVTIGETLAHLSRAYLEQMVDSDGKPPTDHWRRQESMKRIDWIVRAAFDRKLGEEISKSTKVAADAAAKEVRAKYTEIVTSETDKLRAAIATAIAGK